MDQSGRRVRMLAQPIKPRSLATDITCSRSAPDSRVPIPALVPPHIVATTSQHCPVRVTSEVVEFQPYPAGWSGQVPCLDCPDRQRCMLSEFGQLATLRLRCVAPAPPRAQPLCSSVSTVYGPDRRTVGGGWLAQQPQGVSLLTAVNGHAVNGHARRQTVCVITHRCVLLVFP